LVNILTDSLKNIWENRVNNKVLVKIIKRDFDGKCGKCVDRYVCGGCRARAMVLNNNILGADPYCLLCLLC